MSQSIFKNEIIFSYTLQSLVLVNEGLRLLEKFTTVPDLIFSELHSIRGSLGELDSIESYKESARNELLRFKSEDSLYEVIFQAFNLLKSNLKILNQASISYIGILDDDWFAQSVRAIDRSYGYVATLKRQKFLHKINGLYVILDSEFTGGRNLIDIAKQTLSGGTKILQLRDKISDKSETLDKAIELKEICDSAGSLFVVNDDADIALISKSHGLHLGQTDLGVNVAREILLPGIFIGRSNNNILEASESESMGADYLAIGTIFSTNTMGKSERIATGINTIRELRDVTALPIVAIGGINENNVKSVIDAGADSICVVSAITLADDPELETRKIVGNMGV